MRLKTVSTLAFCLFALMAGLTFAHRDRVDGNIVVLPNSKLMHCAFGRSQLWQNEIDENSAVYPLHLVLDHFDTHGCPQGIVALYDKAVRLEDIQAALDQSYGKWARADNANLPVKLWRVEQEKFAIQLAIVTENGGKKSAVKQSTTEQAGMKQVIYLSFAVSEGNRGGFTR